MKESELFRSFLQGGFECSSHRRRDGKRLDVIAATRHDELARADYEVLARHGLNTIRDGARWHLIESRPGHYDFSSLLPMLRAARETGVEVIWDLCHYGWPDGLNIFSPEFVNRFANFARACARVLRQETEGTIFVSVINEISFFAWAGGDTGHMNPFALKRGPELKAQLVRAVIAAVEAVWDTVPGARIVHCEPAIHIVADPGRPQDAIAAETYRLAQFEAWDMLAGRQRPDLGGSERYLDVLGVNFYPNNQWIHNAATLRRGHPLYRPLSEILREIHTRYQKPVFVAETGCEDNARPSWYCHVASEVRRAIASGVPVSGLCLYPIANHPGWDNDRHCHNGLLDYPDDAGKRTVYQPLADEILRQRKLFESGKDIQCATSV